MKSKRIILIIILIISLILLNLSIAYAEESWDDFYLRFRAATEGSGKRSDLTDADLERMIAGPTKEERQSGAIYIDSDALAGMQQKARDWKTTDNQASIIDASSNSNIKDTVSNMTNTDRQKKATELRNEINNFLSGKDISKLSDEGIKRYLSKINEYKMYAGTSLDADIISYHSQLNAELQSRGKQQDTTIYEQQVGMDGTTSGQSTINSGNMGRLEKGTSHTLGEIIREGEGFISASNGEKISQENLKNMSTSLYNILLVVGIVLAVVIGTVLGIKYITEGVEGQVEVKKALVPYIIGCIVVFGAFIIWKIAVDVLQSM